MQIYDISMTISEDMAVYKNKAEKRPRLTVTRDFSSGNIRESSLSLDMHCGTHLDAPLHVLAGGSTIDRQDLTKLAGVRCQVLDLTHLNEKMAAADLALHAIAAGSFVLCKTKNSLSEGFDPDFVYLAAEGAAYLRDQNISGFGLDALGIERGHPDHPAHTILLGHGISVLEGLRLKDVPAGQYLLFALPLKVAGAEASPTRAILVQDR